jgi:hypothetical protein
MIPGALLVIRSEHRSLAVVLHALQQIARDRRDGRLFPDVGKQLFHRIVELAPLPLGHGKAAS